MVEVTNAAQHELAFGSREVEAHASRSGPVGATSTTVDLRLSTRRSVGFPAATPSVPMKVSTTARAEAGARDGPPDG